MMGTKIAKDGNTFQIQILWKPEAMRHCLFHIHIAEIAIQLGERSE